MQTLVGDRSVFLAGASRGVGREIALRLLALSLPVTVLVRQSTQQAELETLGTQVVLGDALNAAQMAMLFQAGNWHAVISTIGGKSATGVRSDYIGNKNLIDAACKKGIDRFILISSIGSGNSRQALPEHVLQVLSEALIEKEKAEQYLINSGLNYTIVRPGGLKSEPATGRGILTTDPRVAGSIHRADVAELVCHCLLSTRADHQIFSAIDRALAYGPQDYTVFEP